jgi:hypothetical protein
MTKTGRKPSIPLPIKDCEYCGKRLVRRISPCGWPESYIMLARRRYCNNRCRADAEMSIPAKRSAHGARARRYVKGECEVCGKKARLDVHHKDGNWQNDSEGNLVTVCRSCHMKIHKAAA